MMRCEAAAVRYVHDGVAGEALNIGVVLLCPEAKFLGAMFSRRLGRVTAAFRDADLVQLGRVARGIERACKIWVNPQTELQLDRDGGLQAFLRSVVPPEDAAVRASQSVYGITRDPAQTLRELFDRYVGRVPEVGVSPMRRDDDVWDAFAALVPEASVLDRVEPTSLKRLTYEVRFPYSWRNGHLNIVAPLSLDGLDPEKLKDRAAQWSGRIHAVHPRDQGVDFFMIIGEPAPERSRDIKTAADDAFVILKEELEGQATVIHEADAEPIAKRLAHDLRDGSLQ